jgi:SM-20-related protein
MLTGAIERSEDRREAAADPALAFLLSCEGVRRPHTGARLIDHLQAVEAKLTGWGCREAVRRAGQFHSIYGTEHFRHRALPLAQRETVRQLIGAEAERLAFLFCTLQARPFLAGIMQDISVGAGQLTAGAEHSAAEKFDLLHIFTANWLEQYPRMRPLQRAHHVETFRRILPLLLPRAAEEVDDTYGFTDARRKPSLATPCAAGAATSAAAVTVLDDFAPEHLRVRLTALAERNIWRYGWKAAKTQTSHGFWHSHFAGDNEDADASCEYELVDRQLVEPILELWHLIRDRIAPGHVPVRVYANGHTYGGDGHLHTDCDRPGHYTSIYYAHAEWDVNWAGETVFFDSAGQDVIKSVFPKPGRLVHFPGQIPHAARTPSRGCPALRAVFVIKTYLAPDRDAA